jgi:hypothetical protein
MWFPDTAICVSACCCVCVSRAGLCTVWRQTASLAGAQITCFTTNVHSLYQYKSTNTDTLRGVAHRVGGRWRGVQGSQVACFTSTKVQILTGGQVLSLLALQVQKYKY